MGSKVSLWSFSLIVCCVRVFRMTDRLGRQGQGTGELMSLAAMDRGHYLRIRQYLDILRDAAEYHLLVNLHGCTLPRGGFVARLEPSS
jgi:hypothetical protein